MPTSLERGQGHLDRLVSLVRLQQLVRRWSEKPGEKLRHHGHQLLSFGCRQWLRWTRGRKSVVQPGTVPGQAARQKSLLYAVHCV